MVCNFVLIPLLFVALVSGERIRSAEILCAEQQNCTSCIQTTDCVWCSDTKSPPLVRCITRARYEKEGELWCPGISEVIDGSSEMRVIENRSLLLTEGSEPVQVQPQKILLKLRAGEEKRITVKYSQAEDYPVDLYYLLDLSASMEEYRDQLSKLGYELTDAMKKLTSNFRLGFGSFVDKVALPMTHTQPEKLVTPCTLKHTHKPCATPYGYKNQMSLTENISLFKNRVEQAPVSGNLDAPEGGLDALLQTIVCAKEIGWRSRARHLVVFSTDADYHVAGDGKLAGIVEPNDGLCHLDEDGYYTHSLLQDYPSVAQINKLVTENNINIVFAVPPQRNLTYQLLTNSVIGSSVGLLDNNFKNVVALISKEYEKLVNTVSMKDNATKIIDIRYFSKCLSKNDDELKERRDCEGLRVGDNVEFDLYVKVPNCSGNKLEWEQSIQVKPAGLQESLMINLEILCNCPCDRNGHPNNVPKSPTCRGNGTSVCGVCYCDEGFYGKFCECQGNIHKSNRTLEEGCRASEDERICSGRGTCKCGICDCDKRINPQEVFYGKYCECDNFSCRRGSNKMICSGRGECKCGTCNCPESWTGETCDCRSTNGTCMPTDDAEICSGHGDCICGKCQCFQKDNVRYFGQFCEECATCPNKLCEEFKDCVECLAHNSGPLTQEKNCGGSCNYDIEIVPIVQQESANNESGAKICRVPGDGGCTFIFKYELYRKGIGGDITIYQITAQDGKICPEAMNPTGVAVSVTVSTVILGIVLLASWKLLTEFHDRKEFERFEKEIIEAKWHKEENPLYKRATTTFSNPTFEDFEGEPIRQELLMK